MNDVEGPSNSLTNLGKELNNWTALVPKDPAITVFSPSVPLIFNVLFRSVPLLLVYLVVNAPGSSTSPLSILKVYIIVYLSILLSQEDSFRALSRSQ